MNRQKKSNQFQADRDFLNLLGKTFLNKNIVYLLSLLMLNEYHQSFRETIHIKNTLNWFIVKFRSSHRKLP